MKIPKDVVARLLKNLTRARLMKPTVAQLEKDWRDLMNYHDCANKKLIEENMSTVTFDVTKE